MQRLNTASINLASHDFNKNNVEIGDTVVVNIGTQYLALVESLKLDSKNKKIFAYLKVYSSSFVPSRVDVADCIKIENNI